MHPPSSSMRSLIAPAVATGVLLGPCVLPVAAEEPPPDVIYVTGVVRDFRGKDEVGGHPDFENRPEHGFGRYSGNIAETLGAGSVPEFTGAGAKVASQWRDSENRQICHALYDEALGDVEGSFSQADTGGVNSAETFAQWYKDEIGVNMSDLLTLALVLQPDGHYVFDDRDDPYFASLGGFFPIDDQLFGNSPGSGHNFHFTYELHLEFEYDAAGDQFFMFIGDDDVFVFIDGRLVIDLGGVHAAHDQYVQLDRLALTDGEAYTIDFFFAERYRPQANFRLETNIPVRNTLLPTVSAIYD